jgi:predicted DNA-binding protein (MmcQ/YjbR family)
MTWPRRFIEMVNLEEIRNYCLSKPHVSEGFPFDEETIVFKVGGKMFALSDVNSFEGINLKCDPDRSVELQESYMGIRPGYHMNKKHWITVNCNADVSREEVYRLIDTSYALVWNGLPKKVRNELEMG